MGPAVVVVRFPFIKHIASLRQAEGRHWTLHSVHDNQQHVSPSVLAKTIDTAAALLDRVADAPRLPLQRRIDAPLMREVTKAARREYRHPWSPQSFDYDR